MADFHYYLNRQGPKGEKGDTGEKGADGKTPTFYTGTNTDLIYTLIIDSGDGNTFETGNLKTPIDNRGGTYLRYDQMTGVQYTGPADSATDSDYGVVILATDENNADDTDAVSFGLLQDYVENHGSGGGINFTTGSAIELTNQNVLNVKIDNDTVQVNQNNELEVPGFNEVASAVEAIVDGESDVFNDYYTKEEVNQLIQTGGQFTAGNGVNLTDGILSVKVDSTTIDFDNSGNLTVIGGSGGGGTTYTAGTAIDLTGNTISVKTDGTTIGVNASNELELKTSIPAAQIQSDWTQADSTKADFIKNKPILGSLANKNTVDYTTDITNEPTLGSLAAKDTVDYNTEVTNKPTIGAGIITFTQGSTTLGFIDVNQTTATTINIPSSGGGGGGSTYAPGNGIEISTSDVISAKVDNSTIGFTAGGELELKATIPTDTGDLTNNAGYITGITSSDVTTALGYTPYNSSNPNGYTSNVGTVTSVNSNLPDANGNVSINIPVVNDSTISFTINGVSAGSITTNQNSGSTIALTDTQYTSSDPIDVTNNNITLNYDSATLDIANGDLKVKDNVFVQESSLQTVHCIIETSPTSILPSWWRLYDDGWVEQGGINNTAGSTILFLKQFTDANYTLPVEYTNKTATSFTMTNTGDWFAAGFKGV